MPQTAPNHRVSRRFRFDVSSGWWSSSMAADRSPDVRRALAAAQGLYYVATGAWPLLSMRTFEVVTGPKTDHWLVKTVGLLALGFGGVLLRDARRGRADPGLGIAAAAAFAASSVWYGGRGRIRRIYLVDGLAELVLIGAWAAASGEDAGRSSDA
jgi:hypothetical protein